MFLLQISTPESTIWRASTALDTEILEDAVQIADRLARACRRTSVSSRAGTLSWVVEIIGEAGAIFYRARVASV